MIKRFIRRVLGLPTEFLVRMPRVQDFRFGVQRRF